MSCARSGAIVAEAQVLNLTPPSKIGTGVCFLDHMLDQLTSHGQLGVTLRCGIVTPSGEEEATSAGDTKKRSAPSAAVEYFAPLKDYAAGLGGRPHDRDIFEAAGAALGMALRRVVDEVCAAAATPHRGGDATVFCCPLDEAFAEAILDLRPADGSHRCDVALEPYGQFAGRASGRRWVGRYRTELTPVFWAALVGALGCRLSLRRVRGANAHHVLESTFKAFARAFRAALDAMADGGSHGCAAPQAGPAAPAAPPSVPRVAERRRATKETAIDVRVDLDAPWLAADAPAGGDSAWTGRVMTPSRLLATVRTTSRVATGIGRLDGVLSELARAAGVHLVVHCDGDRHIDAKRDL